MSTSAVWTEVALEDIPGILAGSRKRGQYLDVLKEFDAADVAGIRVNLLSGPFAGKKANSVYAGFNNMLTHDDHKETLGKRIAVRKIEDAVYLVRLEQES